LAISGAIEKFVVNIESHRPSRARSQRVGLLVTQ